MVRGGIAIGLPRTDALAVAMRCAQDSMPPLRLKILNSVLANPKSGATAVAERIRQPRKTVHRTLVELGLLELLTVDGSAYSLVEEDKVPRLALEAMVARNVSRDIAAPNGGQKCQ